MLDDRDIESALGHAHPGVREQAIQLAEPRLAKSPALAARVVALADDADARVRFQCALSLGKCDDARRVAALATIAARDAADRWARAAVCSSLRTNTEEFLAAVLTQPPDASAGRLSLLHELGQLLGASEPKEKFPALLEAMSSPRATGDLAVKSIADAVDRAFPAAP